MPLDVVRFRARAAALLVLLALATAPARAEARVTLDHETLGSLLSVVAAQELLVPMSGERSLRVVLDEVKLLRLEPAPAGDPGAGRIWAALRVQVPQLGLDLNVEAAVSLEAREREGKSVLELRFRRLPLALPFGALDVASFVPPLVYPADDSFTLAGARGDVTLHSRLVRVTVEERQVTLHLALEPQSARVRK